jgi:hypothetical protein
MNLHQICNGNSAMTLQQLRHLGIEFATDLQRQLGNEFETDL